MDMAQQAAPQTQGIQQLLAAEKRAADKVNLSRRRKAKKLRQAKEEAEEEIEKFRRERDQQFQDYLSKHAGSRSHVEREIEIDTNRKIDELIKAASNQKDKVVEAILDIVEEIKPTIHKNYRQL